MPETASKIVTQQAFNASNQIGIKRRFTTPGKDALSMIECETRSSIITEPNGKVVFELKDLEIPKDWSQLATDTAASKYFRKAGVPVIGGEKSAKKMVYRVANTIRGFGEKHGYFASVEEADNFEQELLYLLITQRAAFNSPVWFNVGMYQQYGIKGNSENFYWNMEQKQIDVEREAYIHPQCSACFIQRVEDDLASIFDLVKNESKLFKYGSGTGTNFSRLRSRYEKLSGGGKSSGLISFLEVLDRAAGAIKSGGTTRRAAKMVILDMDHPEILDFIQWKAKEEKKVAALIAAGYPSDFNGEAYHTVAGQNANNSVRVSDAFMNAALQNEKWQTKARIGGEVVQEYDAKFLLNEISQSAWACADPGMQFDDTINKWNPCSNTDRIYASNPCSEFMFLDDTACNLASINLVKFLSEDNVFDVEGYRHANEVVFLAQEILVDYSSYPTKPIAQNSHDFRPLGLGFANLGTMLMILGVPYDSDKGRAIAASITAMMTGVAYQTSAKIASRIGPFARYEENKEPFMKVMKLHQQAASEISLKDGFDYLHRAAQEDWAKVIELGQQHGYRNAQATVLAPTGTIGLLMDCDTTGVEPDFALVKWKKLAGGGYFKIVNQSIPRSLRTLGYSQEQVEQIISYMLGHGTLDGCPHANASSLKDMGFTEKEIQEAGNYVEKFRVMDDWCPFINPAALRQKGLSDAQIQEARLYIEGSQTIEGAPHVKMDHYAVYDCANKAGTGKRFIAPMGHVKMLAATQPFVSGSISKTVNLPQDITPEEIEFMYVQAWKQGLKCIAMYRDGSKLSQPLNTKSESKEGADVKSPMDAALDGSGPLLRGMKKRLPQKRQGFTVKSIVGGTEIFLRTGEYENKELGEIFIDIHKEGASFRSMLNCFAISVSIGLQYGVPLEKYVDSFTFTRFEPNGMVDHPNIKTCTSIPDYVFRVLGMEYLGRTDFLHVKPKTADDVEGIDDSAMKTISSAPVESNENQLRLSSFNPMEAQLGKMMGDAPPCNICGHITVRNGTCYKCINCGNSIGCS